MVTVEKIRETKPLFDPVTGMNSQGVIVRRGIVSNDYEATVLDFLNHPEFPVLYKLRTVLRGDYLKKSQLIEFCVWSLLNALILISNPDRRVINVCTVALDDTADEHKRRQAIYDAIDAKVEISSKISTDRYLLYGASSALLDNKPDWFYIIDTTIRSMTSLREHAWEYSLACDIERAKHLKKLISIIEHGTY